MPLITDPSHFEAPFGDGVVRTTVRAWTQQGLATLDADTFLKVLDTDLDQHAGMLSDQMRGEIGRRVRALPPEAGRDQDRQDQAGKEKHNG